jgi:hypothetical protein
MLAALLAAAVAAVAAQASCPLLQARYVMAAAPSLTARFERRTPTAGLPSPVSLVVHSSKTGVTYDFVPTHFGNGVGVGDRLVLAPTPGQPAALVDRLEPIFQRMDVYFAARSDYSFYPSFAPAEADQAPAHLLVPNLTELMWYGDFDNRQDAPLAFFDLQSCSP